tara:strand:- start:675 stop:842 length:168 start_codon:yes stop_codon:yes gene_type:complete
MSQPKEFRITRRRVIHENIYIFAKDLVDAEKIACEEEHNWEYLHSHDVFEVDEVE